MLRVILTIVQVFSCFAIIGLVLLQRGKGAEAGAGFGAGASGTVFGARGAGTALSRATAIFVAIFMLNSLLLTYMGTHSSQTTQPKSILDTAGEKSPASGANKLGVTTSPTPATTAPPATAPADTGSVATPTTPAPAANTAPGAASAPSSAPPQPAAPTTPPDGKAPKH
jgi:preprotein translocase subunit SecG